MKLKKKTSIKISRIKTKIKILPIKWAKQYISKDKREREQFTGDKLDHHHIHMPLHTKKRCSSVSNNTMEKQF